MRSKIRTALACLLAFTFIAGIVWAQSVPQLINYQGRLTDSSGQPLADGTTVDLTFSFYGVESGSTSLYLTVLQEDVVVNKGIYNVLIGSGAVTPGTESTLAAVFQNHTDVWMGVRVDTDNEMSPRSRVSTVPYAISVDINSIYSNAISDPDKDGDGYKTVLVGGNDCHDGDSLINPGATEICDDGIDNDCDGEVDQDDLICKPWTWISGSKAANQSGVYGTKGVPDSANVPGGRESSVSWIDGSGNMWLFGGYGYDESAVGYLNDLWKWDGTYWTWMSGSKAINQYGVYGTKGVPDSANVPGARYGAVSWIDGSGNMWLFGGYGYDESAVGSLNDMWKWDGTYWTWMSGNKSRNQYGVYGTKGLSDLGNIPGSRTGAVSWINGAGNLMLFGGSGYAESEYGYLNDLWEWDGTYWTWISGSKAANQSGVYGTKGVPNSANVPGARYHVLSWIDGYGNLWLFGGYGEAASESGYLNDLWRWDGTYWTWMSGSNSTNQNGVYGTKGIPDSVNVPGTRQGAVSWIDGSGNMWLFGGMGYPESGADSLLNDLWRWDGENWTWASGSKTGYEDGVYGTKGVPDLSNIPGARIRPISWIDGSGNLWLFGGHGYAEFYDYGYLNDLWRFE